MKVLDFIVKKAEMAIEPFLIVKPGTDASSVVRATTNTDNMIGIYHGVREAQSGKDVDVAYIGIGKVKLGGTVSAGNQLTSDSSGRAIAVNSSLGSYMRTIGVALESGVDGQVIECLITPGSVTFVA